MLPRNVPTATVALDRERTIAFTLDALLRLQTATGRPLSNVSGSPDEIMQELDLWVWSGLVDEDRDGLAPADVRQMIHLGNLPSIVTAVVNLSGASMPEAAEGNAIPVPPKVRRAAGRI